MGGARCLSTRNVPDAAARADFSKRNPFRAVRKEATLSEVLQIFLGDDASHWVRRVCVVADDPATGKQRVVSQISQSAFIAYLAVHKELLADLAKQSVRQLTASRQRPIVSVRGDQTVFDAFKLMSAENISGLAVVDDEGHLIGSLSIRDLKGLETQDGHMDFSRLMAPVRQFVNYVSSMAVDERHPAISVKEEDTLGKVIVIFASTRVHRCGAAARRGGTERHGAARSGSSRWADGGRAAPQAVRGRRVWLPHYGDRMRRCDSGPGAARARSLKRAACAAVGHTALARMPVRCCAGPRPPCCCCTMSKPPQRMAWFARQTRPPWCLPRYAGQLHWFAPGTTPSRSANASARTAASRMVLA